MGRKQTETTIKMVDLMEEMLFQRAASGIRPALYLSSYTDLECSMCMLLEYSGRGSLGPGISSQPGTHSATTLS